jgi:2-C-methyl-D-erythritol 4-phosphate cytidylyltransferase
VEGRSLLEWSASSLGSAPWVDAVQCVLPPDELDRGSDELAALRTRWRGPARLLAFAPGGALRQDSVAAGLEAAVGALPDLEWVLVHDAARCLVEPSDAEAVLAAARATGAAIPIVPVSDTVKRVAGNRVEETIARETLGRALTPQAFRVSILREAHEKAARDGFVGTDCASLVERLGIEVRVCAGREENGKVTHARDLERAAAVLALRERARGIGS